MTKATYPNNGNPQFLKKQKPLIIDIVILIIIDYPTQTIL